MCPHFQQRISRYHTGDLSVAEARQVQLHLELCKGCRTAAESIEKANSPVPSNLRFAAERMDDETFSHLRARIGEELLEESASRDLRSRLTKPWWLYAGAVVLAVAVGTARFIL